MDVTTAVSIEGPAAKGRVVVCVLHGPQSDTSQTLPSLPMTAYTAEGVMVLSKKSLQSLKVTFLEGPPGSRPATALAHASRVQRERAEDRKDSARTRTKKACIAAYQEF